MIMETIDSLLPLYFHGKLDEQTSHEVEQWILANPENRKIAEKVCRIEQYLGAAKEMQSLPSEEILSLAHRNMAKEERRRKRTRFKWLGAILSTAAMVVVGIWLFLRPDTPSHEVRNGLCEVKECELPDGTKVWLNANSRITYPERFQRRKRVVNLTGEAFFEVEKDARRPFYVQAGDVIIKVVGTRFDVDAYAENTAIFSTTLVDGCVEMRYPLHGHKQTTVLSPGQRLSYDMENDRAFIAYVDVNSLTSWKTGSITLDHTPLRDVLKMIGNAYGVRFIINDTSRLNDSCSGTFVRQPVGNILKTIECATGIHFKPSGNGPDSYIVY
jgi:ferric-dicitrate binding protein FerR (iron transport regulator)